MPLQPLVKPNTARQLNRSPMLISVTPLVVNR
jgi:hypothetical protein